MAARCTCLYLLRKATHKYRTLHTAETANCLSREADTTEVKPKCIIDNNTYIYGVMDCADPQDNKLLEESVLLSSAMYRLSSMEGKCKTFLDYGGGGGGGGIEPHHPGHSEKKNGGLFDATSHFFQLLP
jgi:hypothetical protein